MAQKKAHRATFAEMLAEVPEPPPYEEPGLLSYTVPIPVITGEEGEWHLRGEDFLEGRALHKALRTDLPVFHFYMGKRTLISPDDREAFWARAEALMAESGFSESRGYGYRHEEQGRRCLVVFESC